MWEQCGWPGMIQPIFYCHLGCILNLSLLPMWQPQYPLNTQYPSFIGSIQTQLCVIAPPDTINFPQILYVSFKISKMYSHQHAVTVWDRGPFIFDHWTEGRGDLSKPLRGIHLSTKDEGCAFSTPENPNLTSPSNKLWTIP